MIDAARPVALCLALAAGAAQAEPRLAEGWVAMVDGCMIYAETGARAAAFGAWQAAAAGGACADARDCAADAMTFVAPGALGAGAVTVTVGAADWAASERSQETSVGNFPRHMSCVSADGSGHVTEAILPLHAPFVAEAVAQGRLVEAGVFAGALSGPYLGCGHDGRPYQVEFSLREAGAALLRLYHPAREGGAEGLTPACAGKIG